MRIKIPLQIEASILHALLRLLGWTYRFRVRNWGLIKERIQSGQPLICIYYHGRTPALVHYCTLRDNRPWAIMCSMSRDGSRMEAALGGMGMTMIRGSSGRGALKALVGMQRQLRKEPNIPVGIAIDGSRGPRGYMKSGAVALAKMTGALIVPVCVSPHRSWVLRKTWDRSVLPQPFSKISVSLGAPIKVPKRIDQRGIEAWRVVIDQYFKNMQCCVDQKSGFCDSRSLNAD